ncbi:hypothetical protein [Clostridium tyrobutyricum]|uniref:hypothetical protein n=1 Tax=Clostridium tyrobutyricum TaxID=1519 RepID=UPI00073D3592|nr:hypothetical protein [Clostridium tyrobutyricum]
MKKYKPDTIEENLANIVFIKNNFWNLINSYIFDYNNLIETYTNINFYNYRLNPYSSFENEMIKFAYSVWGFTNDIYERICYALDCWKRIISKKKDGATDKNYDKVIKKLKEKNLIDKRDVPHILNFRSARNYSTHYGRIQFINYIFNHSSLVYSLLETTGDILMQQLNINNEQYLYYIDRQLDFISELKQTLEIYRENNVLI